MRIIDRYAAASAGFQRRLHTVRPEQWAAPTPCGEWTVRQLVNHMTRGNLNYVLLLDGGTGADFLRLRETDALGADPARAYARSVSACLAAFGEPGALQRVLDYPLGAVSGRQALAVRTADTVVHTWDLGRALGAGDRLDTELVSWMEDNLYAIYAGLAETPVAADTTHRFFAAPPGEPAPELPVQDRLLYRTGRDPRWTPGKGR